MALSNWESILLSASITIVLGIGTAGIVYANIDKAPKASEVGGLVMLNSIKAKHSSKTEASTSGKEIVYEELGPSAVYALTKRTTGQYTFPEDRDDRTP